MADAPWYVVTGGPSVGKTTLLNALAKLGYTVVPEAARTIIDEALAAGISVATLRADEKRFQEDIAKRKQVIEASQSRQQITFFDRGMHDTIAYMQQNNSVMEPWLTNLMHGLTYQKVFLLEPLPVFETDYARTEDQTFTKQIHQLLYNAYAAADMVPIIVPPISPEDRLAFVLQHITAGES